MKASYMQQGGETTLHASILMYTFVPVLLLLLNAGHGFSQTGDSIAVLKLVHIAAIRQNNYTSLTPVQTISRSMLQQINAQSIGDAARYFSGVLIKDYGGAGGLKTISVRSLGASGTAVIYDGIPVADIQTGQIDLSRFSTTFIQTLELQQGSLQYALLPARTYASSAALAITTNTYQTKNFIQQSWQAGLGAGSFNLWQPFADICKPVKNNAIVSFHAEGLYSKGNYPVYIDNGPYSGKTRRNNAEVKSAEGEINLLKQFNDSATVQIKAGGYRSARGLPGAIVFFNDRSVQQLWNTDVYVQGRYQKKIDDVTTVLASAKYSHTYTKYTDPDYLNNQGGLDNRYTQQEVYASLAAHRYLKKNFVLSAASDIAYCALDANLKNFAFPQRLSFWDNIALHYTRARWRLQASLLYTGSNDKTANAIAAANKNKFTPAFAFSVVPATESPFMLRFFYKAIFRMPTFNDLYYNFIGNTVLRPEYAKQYNAGITYSRQFTGVVNKFNVSADAYYNVVRDKIIAVPNKNLFVWTMLNLGRVRIKGVDINTDASGKLSSAIAFSGRIAYTWQQALDISAASSSSYKNRIPYTPDHAGSALASFTYKKWTAGYSLLFSGSRYTLGENNPYNRLPGWITQDAFLSRRIPVKRFTMQIKGAVSNVFNHRYDVVRYFPMPGRSFNFSLLFNNL